MKNFNDIIEYRTRDLPACSAVAVYEIMCKNIAQQGRPQMTIRRMRPARWIRKATDTHSEYAVRIVVLPQQWLHERASMLPQ
jgi:hypothetical protein